MNRDYTKRKPPNSLSKTIVLHESAIETAKNKLEFIDDHELFSVLVKLLTQEYFSNHDLYNKHVEELDDLH